MKVLGKLPEPPPSQRRIGIIVSVDTIHRRLYYVFVDLQGTGHLVEFNLSSRIPSRVREAVVPTLPTGQTSPSYTAFDSKRNLLTFVDTFLPATGTVIRRFDLSSFKAKDEWDLSQKAPGFIAAGITYSEADDLYYLVGDLGVNGTADSGTQAFEARGAIGPPTSVIALDAATGAVVWQRPIPQCLQPLTEFAQGTFIGKSTQRQALYFFCFSGGVGAGSRFTFPGGTGLARLSVNPRATTAEALSFPLEFFPISGAYIDGGRTGRVGLDRPTERVFVQSLSSTTPGAWAFDGNISAWLGLIAAPDSSDNFLAINEKSGHYYIGSNSLSNGDSKYLIVSNARMTPPPQGDVFGFPVAGNLVVDSGSKRLFVPMKAPDGSVSIWVLEDTTPDPEAPEPVDYDDLTTNVAEGVGTLSTYSGTLNGFGARVFLVGGVGGARSFANTDDDSLDLVIDTLQHQLQAPIPAITPGDRGIYLGRVAAVDLRNSGAAASAQGVAPDSLTDADLANTRTRVDETPAKPVADQLTWPYPAATCLDGGGGRANMDKPGPGGGASVVCDLAGNLTSATASFTPVTIGPLSIGSTSYTAHSARDVKKGTVSTSTAVAKNIELAIEGTGTLRIARVTATATTLAHGRPGTAKVEYEKVIENVSITDASGKEVFSCGEECDPQKVADAVNSNFGLKVRMDIPRPDLVATSRGAFAGVRKNYRDFIGGQAQNNDSDQAVPAIQITINNDSASKSRVMVQLAAIQAYSIYGISLLSDIPGDDVFPPPVVSGEPPFLPPEIPPAPPVVSPPGNGPQLVATGIRGAFLLARSPKDIAVVMLIFLLIAGLVATAYRRHTMIQHLEDEAL